MRRNQLTLLHITDGSVLSTVIKGIHYTKKNNTMYNICP